MVAFPQFSIQISVIGPHFCLRRQTVVRCSPPPIVGCFKRGFESLRALRRSGTSWSTVSPPPPSGAARAGGAGSAAVSPGGAAGVPAQCSDPQHRRRELRLRGGGRRRARQCRSCGCAARRNRRWCRASARIGEVIQQSKDRHALPCDERAELRDGRPKGCERLGNYYVGPPEVPSGFVFRPTNPDCAAESKGDISMKFIIANEQLQWNPGCAKHPEL